MKALTREGSDTNTARPGRPARYGRVFAAFVAAALAGYAGVAMGGFAKVVDAEPTGPPPEERVALVIGNSSYWHMSPLINGAKDAEGVGAALGRLGFSVTSLLDAGYLDMVLGLQKFAQAAQTAQTAVVFYAGHGHWANGRNLLAPVDAPREDTDAVNLFVENIGFIPMEWLMRSVAGARNLRLVVLDTHVQFPLEPVGETVVAHAAEVGELAKDAGEGERDRNNSPYTTALQKYLEEPGLEVGLLFRKVRADVMEATEDRQKPVVYGLYALPVRGVYLGSTPSEPPASGLQVEVDEPTEEQPSR